MAPPPLSPPPPPAADCCCCPPNPKKTLCIWPGRSCTHTSSNATVPTPLFVHSAAKKAATSSATSCRANAAIADGTGDPIARSRSTSAKLTPPNISKSAWTLCSRAVKGHCSATAGGRGREGVAVPPRREAAAVEPTAVAKDVDDGCGSGCATGAEAVWGG